MPLTSINTNYSVLTTLYFFVSYSLNEKVSIISVNGYGIFCLQEERQLYLSHNK